MSDTARLENPEGKREDLVSSHVGEVREWTPGRRKQTERIRKSLNDTIRKYGYQIPFPERNNIGKTTMKDEGGAGGYTRSNWIALTDVTFSAGNEQSHTRLLVHGNFHIPIAFQPRIQKKMYEAIDLIFCQRLNYPKISGNTGFPIPMSAVGTAMPPFTIDGKTSELLP